MRLILFLMLELDFYGDASLLLPVTKSFPDADSRKRHLSVINIFSLFALQIYRKVFLVFLTHDQHPLLSR